MEKGVTKHWTPEQEAYFNDMLNDMRTFAARDFVMRVRDILKYDGRTKEAKRARAQAKLRLATASDEELINMAKLRVFLTTLPREGSNVKFNEQLYISLEIDSEVVQEELEELKKHRARFQAEGIGAGDLQCQSKNT